jgi:hypothetical protein
MNIKRRLYENIRPRLSAHKQMVFIESKLSANLFPIII